MEEATKVCRTCARTLSLIEFYKKLDAHTAHCKDCTKAKRKTPSARAAAAAYMRRRYAENPQERIDRAIRSKDYQQRHPEKVRAYVARYEGKSDKVVQPRGAPTGPPLYSSDGRYFEITARDLGRQLERQRYECAHCHISIRHEREQDHIIPIGRGGRHTKGNLHFLCPPCNRRKRNLFYSEFRYNI